MRTNKKLLINKAENLFLYFAQHNQNKKRSFIIAASFFFEKFIINLGPAEDFKLFNNKLEPSDLF